MAEEVRIFAAGGEKPQLQHIVAMETSSRCGSLAVGVGGEVLEERRFTPGNRHAAELMPALAEMFGKLGWGSGDISQINISVGPGSFTGIRIAISVARALHLATGAKLVAVPTLEVIVQNAPAGVRDVIVMLDAKRGQVFAGQYRREGGEWVGVRGPRLIEPGAAVEVALAEGLERVHVMGEGIDYHRGALARAEVVEVGREFWVPTARVVYGLGRKLAEGGKFVAAGELLPVYIRLAEAEEVWRKKRGLM